MKLYNSLTKQVEVLKPIKKGQVSLYTCGPTVYDHVTIGNLRTYIFEDTLRRALRLNGYKLKHVMNLTDIDDKTIKRSQEVYGGEDSKQALAKLTQNYETEFLNDAAKVGIDFSGSTIARATEHIADMHKLIKNIPNKYVSEDGVYFDIAKFSDYGVLVKLDRTHEHHRINNDEYDKEHVADFALWKAAKPGEPAWDFEIDGINIAGHPGWHIECSAMSTKYLGQPFDMHTGGVDLKFPHHENEIAQSKSAQGKTLANYWVHGEHLLVNGKKMSKSLKNFYTINDVVKKGYDPIAFRLLVLQAHYRSHLNFTWESLGAAQTNLYNLRAWADLKWQTAVGKPGAGSIEYIGKTLGNIDRAMLDDLNTAKVLAAINELAESMIQSGLNKTDRERFAKLLAHVDEILSLGLSARPDISQEQKTLITVRDKARNTKDFVKSDSVRQELEKQNIGLNDNSYGTTWYRLAG